LGAWSRIAETDRHCHEEIDRLNLVQLHVGSMQDSMTLRDLEVQDGSDKRERRQEDSIVWKEPASTGHQTTSQVRRNHPETPPPFLILSENLSRGNKV
jgi:hypothetical protein